MYEKQHGFWMQETIEDYELGRNRPQVDAKACQHFRYSCDIAQFSLDHYFFFLFETRQY